MKVKPFRPVRLSFLLLALILALAACNGSETSGNGSSTAATTAASAESAESTGVETAEPEAPVEVASDNTPTPASTSTTASVSCESGDANSADDPCVITTVDQLQEITGNLAGHYALGGDIDARATSDWNEGAGFSPIGSFSGSLDGRDFTISGLVIDRPGDMNVGLFSLLEDGILHDISLVEAQVTGGMFVGTLVGNMRGGQISQVHVNADVIGDGWVGGLVGSLHAGGAVTESSAAGSVTGSEERVGGLVGQNGGTISYSFSLSTVDARTAVGGLVGRSAGTIENSYSIVGSVADESTQISGATSGSHVGGLVGINDTNAVISNSYTVSFADSSGTVDFIGHRLVGRDWSSGAGLSDSYWGGNQAIPIDSTDGAKKLDDMRLAESFGGWDFNAVWSIAEGEDYPDLIANPRR